MSHEIDRIMREKHFRTRSEVIRSALRAYIVDQLPTDTATLDELAALKNGRAQIARGEYVVFNKQNYDMDDHTHTKRRQNASSRAGKR